MYSTQTLLWVALSILVRVTTSAYVPTQDDVENWIEATSAFSTDPDVYISVLADDVRFCFNGNGICYGPKDDLKAASEGAVSVYAPDGHTLKVSSWTAGDGFLYTTQNELILKSVDGKCRVKTHPLWILYYNDEGLINEVHEISDKKYDDFVACTQE